MKVLKHGRIYRRNLKKECDYCGCVFKFKLEDISFNNMSPTIYCPECREIMAINLVEKENHVGVLTLLKGAKNKKW